MGPGSQPAALALAQHGDIETIFGQVLQFRLDPAKGSRCFASEDTRVVEAIEKADNQDLTGLKIALNRLKPGPDFAIRVNSGSSEYMKKPGGMRRASAHT